MPLFGFGFFEEMIKIHNDRVRTYWNERLQSVSCRVRNKRENNAVNFRKNIIHYLYGLNEKEFNEKDKEIRMEDYELVQNEFGFAEIANELKLVENNLKTANDELALILQDRIKELHKKQYGLSQSISEVPVIALLHLENVVGVKIKGYYKELFFLKCVLHDMPTQEILRTLYHLNTDIGMEFLEEFEFETYKNEIYYLVEKMIK